ncbi:PEP-CTERM sorting domain-containing protein [Massilia sp. SM-13]|uniref:PEP-CTERM sorting domain-containing protein n=1 Tax=Pseudoduganella rhizocola TaxID=3382643 RepID=UPI0038B41BD9
MLSKHILAAIIFCFASGAALADYRVIKLPDIDVGFYRLNNAGQITGQQIDYIASRAYYRPVLVEPDGTRRRLQASDDFWGGMGDINDLGIVAGNTWNYTVGQQRPVWWDQQGNMHFIEVAGALPSYAKRINNSGVILGRTFIRADESIGWTWQNGRLSYADTAGYKYAALSDLNDSGVLVGRVGEGHSWNAAVWRDGVPELLPGGTGGDAVAINELGWIAGNIGGRAVLWRDGTMIELGNFHVTTMNNRGEIIGYGADLEPYYWRDGGLRLLGPQYTGGLQVYEAFDINDEGQILLEVDGERPWERVLALATPIPEPGQLRLLLAGLVVLALARRQRRQAG